MLIWVNYSCLYILPFFITKITFSMVDIFLIGLSFTAIISAKKPFLMSLAFKNAVISGRQSFLAGRIEKKLYGSASSPKKGII